MVVEIPRQKIKRRIGSKKRFDGSDSIPFDMKFTHPCRVLQGTGAKDKNERMLEHFDKIFEDVTSCGSTSEFLLSFFYLGNNTEIFLECAGS